MRPDVRVDFDRQRRYIPAMKRIVGEHLIGEAPAEEDAQRNTDLIVLRLEAIRIACRVRAPEYMDKYGNEFTIRAGRPSGAKTELQKIIEGWGDYILYGFHDEGGDELAAWVLGDLRAFRLWFQQETVRRAGKPPGSEQGNHDGSSTFRAFAISELPLPFVVARKRPLMTRPPAPVDEFDALVW